MTSSLIPQSQVKDKGFSAFCQPDFEFFKLEVFDGDKNLGFLSMAFEHEVRRFKSVDAVAKTAKKLGFSEVKMRL
ncbi:hypothetical protein [Pseudoalteromonas sp. SR41-6]|uniref:hypothetical protein n=1 Tax=Pseudoalteromonas sp. SR41-6 TaxID=2760948 RepID=UPI00160196CB|nr:hypothetical protein [Pseudoalteromonas sp. SR41-6]MBB1333925.1 hypothetical protein [Pseudoalteromonas sp. SR41-6]